MAEELSYVLVTPYSIRKSRTGGIISRLVSRTGLELIRARMYAPSKELVETYASILVTVTEPKHRAHQELIREYVQRNFRPNKSDPKPRVMMLVFRGEDAVARLRAVVGHHFNEGPAGETIRDTYGDYITDDDGKVIYFEPAVLCPPDAASAERNLKLWTQFSESDGGILEGMAVLPPGATAERTLVLIKPDNFRYPNVRPGGVIDVFSRTGLTIVGAKVHFMSVAQACEFYGPVLDVLKKILGPQNGQESWDSLVQFMSGSNPSECPPEKRDEPGSEKCIALIYEGADAVRKIRTVLGPTDPSKAPPGSIRREFGENIMVNAAHASDSLENAQREMRIIQITENNLQPFVETFYGNLTY